MLLYNQTVCCILLFIFALQIFLFMFITIGFELQPNVHYLLCALKACKYRNTSYILCLLCVTDFSKFCSKTTNSAGGNASYRNYAIMLEILRQILSLTYSDYSGLQLNVDKTLLGLFTSFVGRREFALSVVETTCLEETLFKVVRACMRKTVE